MLKRCETNISTQGGDESPTTNNSDTNRPRLKHSEKKLKLLGVDGMMWGEKRRRVGLIDFVLLADPYFMLICMHTSLVSAFIMHINSPLDGISTHHLSLFLKL